MGIASSKKPPTSKRVRDGPTNGQNVLGDTSEDIVVDSGQRFDQKNISDIKKDLHEKPEEFVLNNMLMCIMFFENYKKEIKELSQKLNEKDGECIFPDILLEVVNRNVLYRPLHGPKKYTSETLMARRLYVVNDMIHIVDSLDSSSTNIKKAAVKMDDSFRKGYVKLREIEIPSAPPLREDIPMAQTEGTPSTSRSSSESDYGYSTITDLKTPKPIDIVKGLEMHQNRPKLPPSCMSYRKSKKFLTDKDINDKGIENFTDEDMFDVISYINSNGFMKFFQNNVFPNGTGANLGFEEYEIKQAKSIPGKIFCGFREENKYTPCEVIPTFLAHWPDKMTLHFSMKAQVRREGPKSRYTFPTQNMISEIQTLNCTLVPKGFVKKKGEHRDSELEWEIQFPQAERYLETFFSHAQVKCFLFLLTLYKRYIEPDTSQWGLLTEHIRLFMLWQCEANYSQWPEHMLGTKMLRLIKALNTHIAQADLRDFFIKEKNVFQNIPSKYLHHAQKKFHDILESPVMSFIAALRNLRYTRGKYFYHPFDFDKLHSILTKTGMESTNQQLISEMYIPPNARKVKYVEVDHHIKHVKEARTKERILKQREKEKKEAEKENLRKLEERRGSVDSVDLKWICERKFDIYKTRALLMFFIDNFIEIAEKCYQISTAKQALMYVKQAKYLTRIMKDECSALKVEELEYMENLNKLEIKCNVKAAQEETTPRENGRVNFIPSSPVSHTSPPSPSVPSSSSLTSSPPSVSFDTKDDSCGTNVVPKANGIAKPRKSVMFAEIH